jgi:hypothetical protein
VDGRNRAMRVVAMAWGRNRVVRVVATEYSGEGAGRWGGVGSGRQGRGGGGREGKGSMLLSQPVVLDARKPAGVEAAGRPPHPRALIVCIGLSPPIVCNLSRFFFNTGRGGVLAKTSGMRCVMVFDI